jgi:hypothetical protein
MNARPLCGLLLAAASAPALAQEADHPVRLRDELRAMELYLESSVSEVVRPSAGVALAGAPTCRGYLLKGYGVVFVLPPRRLPGRGVVTLRRQAPGRESTTITGVITAHTTRGRGQGLQELEELVRMFQSEAQESWEQFESEFFELERRLAAQSGVPLPPHMAALARPPAPEPGRLPGTPAHAVSAQDAVAAPRAEAPEAPDSDEAADEPAGSADVPRGPTREGETTPLPAATPAPPGTPRGPARPQPDRFAPPLPLWQEFAMEAERRTPERVVADTREAVVQALENHAVLLSSLGPEETVTVVVDFMAGTLFLDEDARPVRSLSVRVRKRDLDERRAGRLGAEELRTRVEAAEY